MALFDGRPAIHGANCPGYVARQRLREKPFRSACCDRRRWGMARCVSGATRGSIPTGEITAGRIARGITSEKRNHNRRQLVVGRDYRLRSIGANSFAIRANGIVGFTHALLGRSVPRGYQPAWPSQALAHRVTQAGSVTGSLIYHCIPSVPLLRSCSTKDAPRVPHCQRSFTARHCIARLHCR